MKNSIYKKANIKKDWLVIDASQAVLGRMSSQVAMILKGKHKATYAPNMDCGDNVIIINAEKVHLSGNKLDSRNGKVYYRHTGYPGGIKETTANFILQGKYPERLIKLAVTRMLKKSALRKKILGNLRIYKGNTHPHQAQNPKKYDLSIINKKNIKR